MGGINGTGNYWYAVDQGITSPGRPMPFVWWNASDVTVRNFYVVDPPLWSINLMNVTNAWFDNIYVNATSPQQPSGENWVVNTDGFGMSSPLRPLLLRLMMTRHYGLQQHRTE